MNQIAKTILEQLGGQHFVAMTGARDFVQGDRLLQFRLPRFAGVKTNFVRVVLEADDTYTVEFKRIYGNSITIIAIETNVYCDTLQSTFTARTGLDTHL